MENSLVKTQLKDVAGFLSSTNRTLEAFLNEITISQMKQQVTGDENYYKLILSNLRKLLVFCEEGFEACSVILQSVPFQKAAAEKILFRIFHHCIEEFFSPKNDAWFEDSRSAYTGKNSIKFYKSVPASIHNLVSGLEGDFQGFREELEYYGTDYRTKMTQTK
ncbi:YpuI family protein [Neobacillus vireti]|uniref:YpuI family protein n=1 Tax=Neobacillus vireti TaxID=220686 RepID=UPI002FFD7A74